MDIITPEKRSELMARIRAKDTKPEILVRKVLFSMGLRFRIHYRALPGSPDIVLIRQKKVIFVHGCFWHRHRNCKYAYTPKSRTEFWQKKFQDNVSRDKKARKELKNMGWNTHVIWECETKNTEILLEKISYILSL